jgi:hypothetical protein
MDEVNISVVQPQARRAISLIKSSIIMGMEKWQV